jgi:hypothetical protein
MKNPSRKFIDLIRATSSKWANWDPPNQIKVGDYGNVDKETGRFDKDGNIYTDPVTAPLAAPHPPEVAAPENTLIVSSAGVKRREFTTGAEVVIAGLADASIKGRWEFGSKRGALLIMAKPRSSYIPNAFVKLLIDIPALKDKSLVTEVVSCHAYSLHLSGADQDIIDVALVGAAPISPGATVGAEIGTSWWTQNTSGLFRDACDRSGSCIYTPLYNLKRLRRPGLLRRDSPAPDPKDDDLWVDTREPWDPLDEDGEEVVFEDTVSD